MAKTIKQQQPSELKPQQPKNGLIKVLAKIRGYFKGSLQELRQVRLPDRKSTWSMTLAVILFSAFFVDLIILLDDAFRGLFTLIIK